MLGYKDESTLFKKIQLTPTELICLFPENDNTKNIAEAFFYTGDSLFNIIEDTGWIDSSGKGDVPPDFYSDKHRLMVDLMIIDDYEEITIDKKGKEKIHNRYQQHEHEFYDSMVPTEIKNELKEKNIQLFLVSDMSVENVGKPSYFKYKNCFQRIVNKHIDSIPMYKANHPEYKLGFVIFDESNEYVETIIKFLKWKSFCGKIHIPFLDKNFINVFLDTDIDFIIWYFDCKLTQFSKNDYKQILPKCCIIDVKNYPKELLINYKEEKLQPTNM